MNEDISVLLQHISHGVYIIGVSDGQRCNAFTAAWVMQVSFKPLLLALSINPRHRSYKILQTGGICSINVLDKNQLALVKHFGTPGIEDKMAGYLWQDAKTGAPILSQALAYFDCEVRHYSDAGDHKIAVCEVMDAGLLHKGKVMLYTDTENMDGSHEIYRT